MKRLHISILTLLVGSCMPFAAFAIVDTGGTAMPATETAPSPEATTTEVAPPETAPETMPVEEPPTLSSATVSDITHESARITVAADEPVQAYIEYGTTSFYGMTTPLSGEFSESPSFLLAGLLSETLYHYRVVAADAAGNMTITSDATFMTLAAPAPAPEPEGETGTGETATTTSGGSSGSGVATTTSSGGTATTTPSTATSTPSSGSGTTSEATSATTSPSSTTPLHTASTTVSKAGASGTYGNGGLPVGPFRPMLLQVAPGDSEIAFSWHKPADPHDLGTVLIVRKEGSAYVKSRVDGDVVYEGSDTSFTDTAVKNGVEYHYALYIQGPLGRWSAPTRFQVTPAPESPEAAAPAPALETIAPPEAPTDFPRDLFRGRQGDDVARLQQLLIDTGYYPEALVTGYFGPLTQAAVTRFQQDLGISPTAGYFGPLSRAKAEAIVSADITPR